MLPILLSPYSLRADSCLALLHVAGTEHIEVEWRPVLADLRLHQRRVVLGVSGVADVLQLAGVVHQVVQGHVAGRVQLVERSGVAVVVQAEPAHQLVLAVDNGTEERSLTSVPGLAAVSLFEIVGRWNQFTAPLLYITDPSKYTVQLALQRVVASNDSVSGADVVLPNTQMAAVVIAVGMLVLIFPFVQRFFVKGIVLGATKE